MPGYIHPHLSISGLRLSRLARARQHIRANKYLSAGRVISFSVGRTTGIGLNIEKIR